MKKRLLRIIIIFLGVILIGKFTKDLRRLLSATQQIKKAEERVAKLEEQRKQLSEKYQYYQTPEFIEEEARNKLNMAKPGETIVILPNNLNELLNHRQKFQENSLPNWRKWWKLFF